MVSNHPRTVRRRTGLAAIGLLFVQAFFLICASITTAYADDQPVLPDIYWSVYAGPSQVDYGSPDEAFAAYQAWLSQQTGIDWYVGNFRVCQPSTNPKTVKINGLDVYHCWTMFNSDGTVHQQETGYVSLRTVCPAEKPGQTSKSRIPSPPPEINDVEVMCSGQAGGQIRTPPPPAYEPACCGNPIIAETKTKIERAVDLDLGNPLRFERVYTSNTGEWRHSFSDRAGNLTLNSLPSGPDAACFRSTITLGSVTRRVCLPYVNNADLNRTNASDWIVDRPDGRTVGFSSTTGRSISVGTRETAHQVLDGSGQYGGLVVYGENQQIDEFDRVGRLVKRSRLDGGGVLLTYLGPAGEKEPAAAPSCLGVSTGPKAPGKPSCVTDRITGRQLNFSYDSAGTLTSITDPAGGVVAYQYGGPSAIGSAQGLDSPTSVLYPDSTSRIYHYNEPARTSSANLPGALTGITDENNVRYAYFGYDTSGRAISTSHANGVYSFTLSGGGDQVTDPLGTQRFYSPLFKSALASDGSVASAAYVPGTRTIPSVTGGTVNSSVTYDARFNVASRTEFSGTRTTYSYDPIRPLETQRVEASGTARARTINTRWHPDWRLRIQSAEPKRMTWWIYNGQQDPTDGNATVTCAPSSAVVDGKPIAVLCKRIEQSTTDADGTAGFNASTTGTPRIWTYTYNADGQVLTEDGPRTDVADTTTYTYYGADDSSAAQEYRRGDLQTVTNALGHTTTFNTYNRLGQPLTITDSNGIVTIMTYDARARLTSRSVGGEATSFVYWSTGLLKKVTLPDASYVQYTYDDAHRLTRVEDGQGNHIEYTLDGMGNRTAENVYDPSNALSRARTQLYDNLSRLWKQISAGGIVTSELGYDNNGNPLSAAAPLGRNSANQYDELDRLKQITDPLNGITKFGYDATDNLTSVIDPRNLTTSYTYNGFGDLTQVTSPDTGTSTSLYDSAGNIATRTDARSKTGTYGYDALNRVTSIAYPDQTTAFTYDAGVNGKGHLTGASDAAHSLTWTYDAQGRVGSKTQTVSGQTKNVSYAYTNGNLTSLVTPAGQTVTYGYSNNRVTSVAVNGATVLSDVIYDPFGASRQWQWGNGTLAVRTFDQDGKVTQLDSAGLRTYGYDDAFRITGIEDADDASRSRFFGYDAGDRLVFETNVEPEIALSASTAVSGDAVAVTLTSVPANSGYWLALASTSALRTTYVSSIAVSAVGGTFVWNVTAPSFAGTYEVRLFAGGGFNQISSKGTLTVSAPAPSGQPTLSVNAGSALPGATVTARLANAPGGSSDGIALALVGSPVNSSLKWMNVGTGVTSREWTTTLPTTAGNYEFRLVTNGGTTLAASSSVVVATTAPPVSTAGSNPSSRGYTYDLVGNRLTQTGGGASTFTIASTSNRLSSVSGSLTRAYTYDAAGNATSDGTNGYSYDDAGRLKSVTRGGVTTTYVYNALGQRVKKSGGAVTRYFVYDEAGHLLGEYDGSGAPVQETIWLDDIPVATLRPNGAGISIYYVHTDHLNAPRRISRPSDNVVVWRWDSDAFGSTAANEDPDGDGAAFVYGLRFPGQYLDLESGTVYNYFRDYDPYTGRYLESDPIGLDGGINTYAYVDGDPVSLFDVLGLAKCRYSISNHTLVCESDDLTRAGMVGPEGLFSGRGKCANNPSCSDQPFSGPVPPGEYEMVPTDHFPGGAWWLKEGFFTRQKCKLGYGRCEFFLHLGSFSEGCITTERDNPKAAAQYARLRKILDGDPKNTLTVEP